MRYAREGHPNASLLADKLAWMEGRDPETRRSGVVTSSGMSVISAVLLGLLKAGGHIIVGNQLYGRCRRPLTQELPLCRFSHEVTGLERAAPKLYYPMFK